jgi:adenylate kinase
LLWKLNDEILVQRLLERGKTSGRPDDQDEEKIRNRYQEYNEKTAPLMDYYKAQGQILRSRWYWIYSRSY